MALLHVDCFSEVLGRCVNIDVVLPQRAAGQIGAVGWQGQGDCPVLYLLHGMSDDHTCWQRRTSIERYVEGCGLAVVMPSTDLGWYTNTCYGMRYWDFVSRELPALCHEFFPQLSAKREDTFAAGLSMGGYGALKLGLGVPGTFAAVASLSGALDTALIGRSAISEHDKAFWEGVFGPLDRLPGSGNDLFVLAKALKESGAPLPKLYLCCGEQDPILCASRKARGVFEELGYDVAYKESPGTHNWEYWDAEIQEILRWLPLRNKA